MIAPREPRPEAVVEIARRGQQLDPAHAPRTEHREERRLERRRRDDREEWDEEPADAERADERHGHEEQQPETDGDRRTGEENGPPGRLHCPDDRQVHVLGRSELLAEAVDDEERVIDREPKPDELDEVRDVAHHRHLVREEEDGAQGRGDRARGEREGHEHREREAEHREQHRECYRERDRLAAQQVVRQHRLEVVLDRRLAGDVCVRLARERAAQGRRVALRVLEVERRVDLTVEEPAARSQP